MKRGPRGSLFSIQLNRASWVSSHLGEGHYLAGSAPGLRPFRSYADNLMIL
jgi:hypothetical protein